MRAYVTILDGEMSLLRYFVRHYKRLGVTEFHILVYSPQDSDSPSVTQTQPSDFIHSTVSQIIIGEGCSYKHINSLDEKTFSAHLREKIIKEYHERTHGDYAFFCDLDEFADITPEQLQDFIKSGKPFIWGEWVDRVGKKGKLIDIDPTLPTLEEQFPCRTSKPMRKLLKMGGPAFVFGKVAPTHHHPTSCSYCKPLLKKALKIRVHHFKWQGNVISRLTERIRRIIAKGKEKSDWYKKVSRTLRHLKKYGGIRPSLVVPCKKKLGI